MSKTYRDRRFTVSKEFTGHASRKPRAVVRFCGDFIEDFDTAKKARDAATRLAKERRDRLAA